MTELNNLMESVRSLQDKYNELTDGLSDREKNLLDTAINVINEAGTDVNNIEKVKKEQLEIIKNLENGN